MLPGGIILTGGGSGVATMTDLAKAVLKLPSRTATMESGVASKMQLKDGSWAVAYGLTIWGITAGGDFEGGSAGDGLGLGDMAKSAWRWFKKFLP